MKIVISTYQISDPSHPHFFTPAHLSAIRAAAGRGSDVRVFTDPREAGEHVEDAEVIAAFPFSMPPLAEAKKLKWLHTFSAGVDRVLTDETRHLPILISNSSGIHAIPIAEHLLGFMLIFSHRFPATFRHQTKHRWHRDDGIRELRGKTLLVAGLGDIGREAARLAHGLGMRVIAIARRTHRKPRFVDELGTGKILDALLPQADFVAVCLPYTSETHHLFDMKKFRKMKPSAVIMNIARGPIIHEEHLIEALRKDIIGGAGLDVTEHEPLPKESPLWDIDNVVVTPHHSGLSEKYMDRAVELFCRNIAAYRAGRRLPTLVNKTLGY